MKNIALLAMVLFSVSLLAQPTSYGELMKISGELERGSALVKREIVGRSVEGREIIALHFSKSGIDADKSKIRVLIHAQQHGNEQSGKEGALLLAKELIKDEYAYLFERIDLVLVPQVNPDGSEKNGRRNSNGMDLNRNHLIMTEPEVIALHRLFDKYLFEVTLDAHEYSPYGESWVKAGFRKNSDILLGINTNPQIPSSIRDFQREMFWPFWLNAVQKHGVSAGMYSPGGPPEGDYIRYSTFDINDGRQSFGIQNTFSFIQEGMNGEDNYVENLPHRSYSQFCGMMTLLKFVYDNGAEMKRRVKEERNRLLNPEMRESVALQMDHFPDGSTLELPVFSYRTKRDSAVTVKNFRPLVKATLNVEKPEGYLIPVSDKDLTEWVKRHGFTVSKISEKRDLKFEKIRILAVDSVDFEGDVIPFPQISVSDTDAGILIENYIYVPTAQLKGNLLVKALEPQSEIGLATYRQFDFLMRAQSDYPVIRVRRNEN